MKIILQYFSSKLINNLDNLSEEHEIIAINIDNNIYQIEQKLNPDLYVLCSEKIGHEEIHFINNTDKKIMIYNTNSSDISLKNKNITILNDSSLPLLYNPKRFYNQNIEKDIEYCYFLDKDKEIPNELSKHLIPNKVNKIKLFNNSNISHPQNLGYLSEDDKSYILNRSKNYICKDMFYAIEASLCGCNIVDTNLNPISLDIKNYQTYAQYFEDIL